MDCYKKPWHAIAAQSFTIGPKAWHRRSIGDLPALRQLQMPWFLFHNKYDISDLKSINSKLNQVTNGAI